LIKCENGLPYCKDVSDQSTKVASFLSHPVNHVIDRLIGRWITF